MENRDEHLWKIAKKRASFKKQLAAYIVINSFLWILWFFTTGKHDADYDGIPWPIWSTLGWGVGLAFSYYGAYVYDRESDIIREYQKLKDKEKEQ
jgi:hypothetical protein